MWEKRPPLQNTPSVLFLSEHAANHTGLALCTCLFAFFPFVTLLSEFPKERNASDLGRFSVMFLDCTICFRRRCMSRLFGEVCFTCSHLIFRGPLEPIKSIESIWKKQCQFQQNRQFVCVMKFCETNIVSMSFGSRSVLATQWSQL